MKPALESRWVGVCIKPTKKFVRQYVGKKCKTYQKGCACCDGWKEFEATGFLTTIVDNERLCKLLVKGML